MSKIFVKIPTIAEQLAVIALNNKDVKQLALAVEMMNFNAEKEDVIHNSR